MLKCINAAADILIV